MHLVKKNSIQSKPNLDFISTNLGWFHRHKKSRNSLYKDNNNTLQIPECPIEEWDAKRINYEFVPTPKIIKIYDNFKDIRNANKSHV